MKRFIIMFFMITSLVLSQDMIVRVYAPSWKDLKKISSEPLDIAGAHGGAWYDIVADDALLSTIAASGLPYEVTIHSLAQRKKEVRWNYLSYAEVNDSLRQMVQNHSSICKLESLPIPTYQGNWIYGIKISDNPYIEDEYKPGFLIDALHHSREWACISLVLFFADSMLNSYEVVPGITDIIDSTEMYCFPIINADGYLFDYPGEQGWRKNREPFGGYIGTDPNRNYGGCSGDIEGDWGAVDEDQASHHPNNIVFCGSYVNSGDETRALTMFVKSHIINANMSYHSYGEMILWAWGWTGDPAPDDIIFAYIGNKMADLVQKLGGGTYDRGPGYSAIYPTCGSSDEWVYSWNHYVAGISNLAFTTEIGTEFYQDTSDLGSICRENFKALECLANFCDSIILYCDAVVAAPDIYPVGTVNDIFTIYWHPVQSGYSHPTHWELVELTSPSVIEDDLESGTDRWVPDGFTLSTDQAHSGTHSFFSGTGYNMNSAIRTAHPYLVQSGDSVTFWCWYNLRDDRHVVVVEISENTKEWFNVDTTRFTGNSNGWVREAYSLEDWVSKSIYIRFRMMTDGYYYYDGFYVDDISPVCLYADVDTIASDITDTLYQFTGHALGEYYYYVRGSNATWGWGDYSSLEKANVVGIVEKESPDIYTTPNFSIHPNPFSGSTDIRYQISAVGKAQLKIYNITGRLIRSFDPDDLRTNGQFDCIIWDGTDQHGKRVPAGVYFVYFTADDYGKIEKAVLLR
jgi:hypothetical protein